MAQPKILVIDDEEDLLELLRFNLQKEGYEVETATDGLSGLEAAQKIPDLVILDLMLPALNGLEVCRRLKGEPATASIPILMLTAKGEETDIVVGLEMGADDYLSKPFRMRELLARVKALLRRRTANQPKEVLRFGALILDQGRFQAVLDGQPLLLTTFEFKILWVLAENAGRVLSRRQILKAAASDRITIDRTVDVHIRKLRQKLGKAKDLLETVRGVGYRIRL